VHPDALHVSNASTDQVGHLAAAGGVEVSELTLIRDSLEDAFLRMTVLDRKAA
jgi:ABC-2 type transport system ATP-binding protein